MTLSKKIKRHSNEFSKTLKNGPKGKLKKRNPALHLISTAHDEEGQNTCRRRPKHGRLVHEIDVPERDYRVVHMVAEFINIKSRNCAQSVAH